MVLETHVKLEIQDTQGPETGRDRLESRDMANVTFISVAEYPSGGGKRFGALGQC